MLSLYEEVFRSGRPYVYPTIQMVQLFIIKSWMRIPSNNTLHYFLLTKGINDKLLKVCRLTQIPNRRTIDRRFQVLPIGDSIILKLVHPIISRLKSRYVWKRGKNHKIMQKLDPIQISWIIKSKEDGAKNADVASSMKISVRWVQKLYSRYRRTGAVPILGKPGRPKGIITEQMVQTVQSAFEKFRCSAVFLEKIIDTTGTHIPETWA